MENENPDLENPVGTETGLKQLVVNYIGEKAAETQDVTVNMAVNVFAEEFPEFLMAIAEENFIRGYEQALTDAETAWRQTNAPDAAMEAAGAVSPEE
tara:strand:+ start:186 stop:476 length:291 start_codon:yes stop_codon:yes gene_type:complete